MQRSDPFQPIGAELERLRSLFQTIVEQGEDSLYVKDPQGCYRYINPAGGRHLERSPDEVIGKDDVELFGAEQAREIRRIDQRVMETRQACTYQSAREVGGERRVFLTSKYPYYDEEGQLIGIMGLTRDLTGLLRVQEAARRADADLRRLVEVSPDLIAVSDGGSIRWANRATLELLGKDSADELEAEEIAARFDLSDMQAASNLMKEGAVAGPVELRLSMPDGPPRYIELLAVHTHWDGEPAWLFVGRDLTERRALEQRLTRAQRLASVGTLAAGVAHEINNPLTYVIHHLDQLEGALTGASAMPPERMARYARQAREGVERIARIVRDLMLFARDPRADDALVDVGQALQAAVQIAEHQLRHRAQLQVELAELPRVLGAEGRLTQVFVNLLLNAAQAIPLGDAENHCVRVEAGLAVGGLRVRIRDTGPGIPLAVRERLFEPFVTTKMPGEGTGLGLWICHNIITSMGGRIDVESELGRGTAMVIWLPAAPGEPAMEGQEAEGAGEAPMQALRLLVVDDEPLIREILQEGLVGLGEVLAAGSGRQALELIAAQPDFDLILCDLMMPDVTGVELAQHLERSTPELARRMIFLTGGAFSEEARAFLEGRERLRKPVGLAEVIQAIEGRIGVLGPYPRAPLGSGPPGV